MTSITDKLGAAKAVLVRVHPFYAHLALRMEFIEEPRLSPPTMATDMINVYYHPGFVEKHSVRELAGVIAHEVLHVAFLHGTRRGFRDPKIWNYATDFAINAILHESDMVLPTPHLYDKKYENMSAFDIYELLLKDQEKMKKYAVPSDLEGKDGGGGEEGEKVELWGGIMDPKDGNGKPLSEAEISDLEAETQIAVESAAEAAKSRGNLPASLKGLLKATKEAQVNWKQYIIEWVSGQKPDDYTWRRPSKKLLVNHGIYNPTIERHGAGVGLLSIDTSGSVSDSELVSYINEIVGLIDICNPDKLIIIQHDAKIQRVDEWESGMDFNELKISGRGGTLIQPSFKFAAEMDETPDWMICFTDMGIGDWPSVEPDFPVLWCATGDYGTPPFGTVIKIKGII